MIELTEIGLKQDVVFAAGGVLARHTVTGEQFAVVHRRRYGDYCLPKGKVRDGESFLDAALREVREETGVGATAGRFIGSISYPANGQSKVVLFWAMSQLDGAIVDLDRDEVEEVLWLPGDEALRRLDYPGERTILQQAMSLTDDPKDAETTHSALSQFWMGRPQYQRLKRNLESFRSDLDARLRQAREIPDWGITAKGLLQESYRFLGQHDLESAWHCLHAAQRALVFGFNKEEIAIRARLLRLEVEKVSSSWRRKAIEQLLGDTNMTVSAQTLHSALSIFDEYSDNQYHRISLLRDQLRNLVVISAVALLAFLAVASTPPSLGNRTAWDWHLIVAVLSFGVLGACFSAAQSITREYGKSNIPDQVANKWLTLTRTVLGATPGLAAYAFLQSNILALGTISIEKTLAVAFVAGFSERLVLRAIEAVTGKDANSGSKQSAR